MGKHSKYPQKVKKLFNLKLKTYKTVRIGSLLAIESRYELSTGERREIAASCKNLKQEVKTSRHTYRTDSASYK